MGNVRAVTALSKLQTLLDELRDRRWRGPLPTHDIARLLSSRGRVADATIRDATQRGFLRKKSETEYELTSVGLKAVHTRAVWTPMTTRSATPPSTPGRPRFTSADSELADSSEALVKDIKDSRRESVDRLNTTRVSTDSSTSIYINNINGGRTRSKRDAKKQQTKLDRQRKRDKAKAVIAATKQGTPSVSLSESVEQHKAYAMALAYENQLGNYQNKPTLKYLKGIVRPTDRNYGTWLRAAVQADDLSVDYEFYVKAQFYWFDNWFSRAPKPYELASYKTTFNAKERVRLYKQAISQGQANPERQVLTRVRTAPKISRSVRFTTSARQLATLMENYEATEEDILKVFAKGNQASLYFDREWLRTNETYQRLKEAGEL